MTNFKSVLPFWIALTLNFCSLLVLGWNFGPSTGYGLITQWHSIWLVFNAIFAIISLVLILLMLIVSIWGICSVGKGGELQIGSWNMQTIVEFLMLVFGIASIFVFVFSCAGAGFVSFGAVLYLVIVATILGTYVLLRQKGFIEKQGVLEKMTKQPKQKIQKAKSKRTKSETEKES